MVIETLHACRQLQYDVQKRLNVCCVNVPGLICVAQSPVSVNPGLKLMKKLNQLATIFCKINETLHAPAPCFNVG